MTKVFFQRFPYCIAIYPYFAILLSFNGLVCCCVCQGFEQLEQIENAILRTHSVFQRLLIPFFGIESQLI